MFEIEIDDKTVKVMQLEDWKTSIENDFKPGDYFDEGISDYFTETAPSILI